MVILYAAEMTGAIDTKRPSLQDKHTASNLQLGDQEGDGNLGGQVIIRGDPVALWWQPGVRGGDRITLSLIQRPLGVSCPLYMAVCKRSAPQDARVADAPETEPLSPSPVTC